MLDQGGPIGRAQSDANFDRHAGAFDRHGFCRWPIESRAGELLGCVGIMPSRADHPMGPHFELGWRLVRHAWETVLPRRRRGRLIDAFTRIGSTEIFANTAPSNLRSQAVMTRLQLVRDASRDYFWRHEDGRTGQGLVWVAYSHSMSLSARDQSA